MFKSLFKIFLNNLKVKGFQLVLETLTSSMLEFNRKAQFGEFDLNNHQKNDTSNSFQSPMMRAKETNINQGKGNFLKNLFK